jgi:hypothetical protein
VQGRGELDVGVAAQPGVVYFEGAEGGETEEAGEGEIASQEGVGRDVDVVGDDGDVVGDVAGVDVDGRAGDAGQGEVGEGGQRRGEGDGQTLGAVRGDQRVWGVVGDNLHRRDVLGAPAAYRERAEVVQPGECGDGRFGVEGGGEGEGEGLETGAGAEEGEDGLGRVCGPPGADGEGADEGAVAGRDMPDEGAEGGGGGEGDVGEEGGETEGTGGGGGGGEGADGVGGEEGDDGEVELCGEAVPGHGGWRGTGRGGICSDHAPSLSVAVRARRPRFDPIHKDDASENPPYHPVTFRPTRHISVHPGNIKPQIAPGSHHSAAICPFGERSLFAPPARNNYVLL